MPSKKTRALRAGVVATVAVLLSLPLISQHLRAQDDASKGAKAGAAGAAVADKKDDPKKVLATAGEAKLTVGEFDKILSQLPPAQQSQVIAGSESKQEFARRLLMVKSLAQEAEKRKLDQDEKVKDQLDSARAQVLAQALVMSLPTDEASDRKFFADHPQEFGKVQARHILVSTRGSDDSKNPKQALSDAEAKKKADDIRARVVKGEDFATLAKKESDDPGSKDTGGEYTFGRGQFVPAFEKAAYALKEKEISQPIKTQFGYHVIQLLKHLPATFEEARPMIPNQRIEVLFKELTNGGHIQFDPSMTDDAAASAPAPKPAPSAAPAKSAK